MTDYDNRNSGIITSNPRRTQDNHPTHAGSATVVCPHCSALAGFWINGWVKEGRDGSKLSGKRYFSLSFKPQDRQPDQAATSAPAAQPAPAPQATFDDDIPF